ncbi:hypothetical protein ACXYMU_05500 [Pontibacter sp. CAU 1760]
MHDYNLFDESGRRKEFPITGYIYSPAFHTASLSEAVKVAAHADKL